MSWEQFGAFAIMSFVMSFFVTGWPLIRAIAFCALWQALTPVRPWQIDIPMLAVGMVVTEFSYLRMTAKGWK